MCYQNNIEKAQLRLRNYIYSRVFNKSDINDIVQEVNQVLIKKENEYDSNKSFTAWALGIAKYQIKGYLSNIKRNRITYLPHHYDTWEDYGIDQGKKISSETLIANESILAMKKKLTLNEFIDSPLDILDKAEQKEKINKYMNSFRRLLSQRECEVFDLSRKNKKQVEISKILNIQACHVSLYLSNALVKIKNHKHRNSNNHETYNRP